MCLYYIAKSTPMDKLTDKVKSGYKIMRRFVDKGFPVYESEVFSFYHLAFPANKWMVNQRTKTLETFEGTLYISGFHVFSSIIAARKWKEEMSYQGFMVIVKVKARKINAEGMQELEADGKLAKVFVAQEIKILKEVK